MVVSGAHKQTGVASSGNSCLGVAAASELGQPAMPAGQGTAHANPHLM